MTVQQSLSCCLQGVKILETLPLERFLRSSTHLTIATSLSLQRQTGQLLFSLSQMVSLPWLYILSYLYSSDLVTVDFPEAAFIILIV